MAIHLRAKTSAEVVERRWLAPVDSDDGASSVSAFASGVTVDSAALEGDTVVLVLSAGTTGETASITITVTTSQGRALIDTLYIPIIVSTASAMTARDIVTFALRKVVGIGETPDAEMAADGLERLADMLDTWRVSGADVGAPSPLLLGSVINCPPGFVSAIKSNLILRIADLYNLEVSPMVERDAMRGLQHIKTVNLSDDRKSAVYY